MIKAFNPKEVLQISVNVEIAGEKLYSDLEEKAKQPEIKKVWHCLSEQEVEHKKVFQEMLDNATEYIVHEFQPGEYEAYMRAIAAEYIFAPDLIEKKLKEGFKSDLEAVAFGIKIERESIEVYSALKEYILADKVNILDKIIEEERKHFANLVTLKDYLSKTQ